MSVRNVVIYEPIPEAEMVTEPAEVLALLARKMDLSDEELVHLANCQRCDTEPMGYEWEFDRPHLRGQLSEREGPVEPAEKMLRREEHYRRWGWRVGNVGPWYVTIEDGQTFDPERQPGAGHRLAAYNEATAHGAQLVVTGEWTDEELARVAAWVEEPGTWEVPADA